MTKKLLIYGIVLLIILGQAQSLAWGVDITSGEESAILFPRAQDSYDDEHIVGFFNILKHRIQLEPFNLVASGIFLMAIVHTMLTNYFQRKSHDIEKRYDALKKQGLRAERSHSIPASILHLISEIETVFGLWLVVLAVAMASFYSWGNFVAYINSLHYTEPLFKIVIMTIAASRPIIKLFETMFYKLTKVFGNTLEAWWLSILILSPLLGSIITEPAAMTIGALLLADKFYVLKPSKRLKYITLALLFANVSIGSSLTALTGMPVLMVSGAWGWDSAYVFMAIGWKAVIAIVLSTSAYFLIVRKDLNALHEAYLANRYRQYIQHRFISEKELEGIFIQLEQNIDKRMAFSSEFKAYSFILKENIKDLALEKLSEEELEIYDVENAIEEKFDDILMDQMKRTLPGLLPSDIRPEYHDPNWDQRHDKVPIWVIGVHIVFLLWTVLNAHEPVLFLTGFLFYLGFYEVTNFYQNRLDLKPALLVAFFLSGLMIHGALQTWWVAPLLASLPEFGLNLVAILLSSFKDNASIAYLSTLVDNFPDAMKYALFTGALSGGGLTIIANAPNAVGASILKKHFKEGISFVLLLRFALLPMVIMTLVFYILR